MPNGLIYSKLWRFTEPEKAIAMYLIAIPKDRFLLHLRVRPAVGQSAYLIAWIAADSLQANDLGCSS